MYQIIKSIVDRSDFESEVFESDIDHIRFLIRYIPRLSVAMIARKLKQKTTNVIWSKHHDMLSKHFWKNKIFWSDRYFVCSIGEASPNTIKKYIETPG